MCAPHQAPHWARAPFILTSIPQIPLSSWAINCTFNCTPHLSYGFTTLLCCAPTTPIVKLVTLSRNTTMQFFGDEFIIVALLLLILQLHRRTGLQQTYKHIHNMIKKQRKYTVETKQIHIPRWLHIQEGTKHKYMENKLLAWPVLSFTFVLSSLNNVKKRPCRTQNNILFPVTIK